MDEAASSAPPRTQTLSSSGVSTVSGGRGNPINMEERPDGGLGPLSFQTCGHLVNHCTQQVELLFKLGDADFLTCLNT